MEVSHCVARAWGVYCKWGRRIWLRVAGGATLGWKLVSWWLRGVVWEALLVGGTEVRVRRVRQFRTAGGWSVGAKGH